MSHDDPRTPVTIDFGSVTLTGLLEHDPVQNSLALLTDEGAEIISTNLIDAYGIVPEPGNVIIKDWSEHSGLAPRLEAQGLATIVQRHAVYPQGRGSYKLDAYEIRLN